MYNRLISERAPETRRNNLLELASRERVSARGDVFLRGVDGNWWGRDALDISWVAPVTSRMLSRGSVISNAVGRGMLGYWDAGRMVSGRSERAMIAW